MYIQNILMRSIQDCIFQSWLCATFMWWVATWVFPSPRPAPWMVSCTSCVGSILVHRHMDPWLGSHVNHSLSPQNTCRLTCPQMKLCSTFVRFAYMEKVRQVCFDGKNAILMLIMVISDTFLVIKTKTLVFVISLHRGVQYHAVMSP